MKHIGRLSIVMVLLSGCASSMPVTSEPDVVYRTISVKSVVPTIPLPSVDDYSANPSHWVTPIPDRPPDLVVPIEGEHANTTAIEAIKVFASDGQKVALQPTVYGDTRFARTLASRRVFSVRQSLAGQVEVYEVEYDPTNAGRRLLLWRID